MLVEDVEGGRREINREMLGRTYVWSPEHHRGTGRPSKFQQGLGNFTLP